jgi:adenine/guanine phosphoribosyltransferase-like PRPP-binding protein
MPRTSYHVSITTRPDREAMLPPYRDYYPVALCNGTLLHLPIQPLPGGRQAIALLMSNQTDFAVEKALGASLCKVAAEFSPEVIVGIPTLGLDYARIVARDLGFPNYVALGNSRKFWYSDEHSMAVHSVTSPEANKKLYLDPMLIERVAGKRTLIVDDVINSGGSAAAAIHLLQNAGAIVIGLCVALIEGAAWKDALAAFSPDWPARVRGIGQIPVFFRAAEGWLPME